MSYLIKKLRVQLNLSQEQLASKVNTNQSTISRIENNCHKTSYEVVYKILLYLQMASFNQKTLIKTFVNANCVEFISAVMDNDEARKMINESPKNSARRFIASLI